VRILVKVGGAQLEQRAPRAELARSVRSARAAGHELVLVHGGGNQIRALVRALGLPELYHRGLRVTDERTADVVLMVLAGLVNKELVHALELTGVRACGLSGADGSTFLAAKRREPGADLGYVGDVGRTDTRLVETLLAAGYVPVVATAAPIDPREDAADDHAYNVNADLAAGPLAQALGAEALLFLTDVEGVRGVDGRRIETLTPARCGELTAAGVLQGGMLPKVEAALAALAANQAALVKIAPAHGVDAVLAALSPGTGTRFVVEG
jgi:acetylglutamate kinase